MRIFACRAVKPGDWRKCDCPKSIKRCSWETLGDIERSWEFLGVELLAFLLTTRAQQTSHSTVLIRTTLLSACWASAQRQAASHPGFRSNIAHLRLPGGQARRLAQTSRLESGAILRIFACWAKARRLAASRPDSGAILQSRAGFASEKRGKCT